jgi:hypothetical protein
MSYTFHIWENSYLYFRSSHPYRYVAIIRMLSITIYSPASSFLRICHHIDSAREPAIAIHNSQVLFLRARASSSLPLNLATPNIYRAPIHASIVH